MKSVRQIIRIDRNKCNGCGLCVNACHEGALKLQDGKAVLAADYFCDGLGACIGECPQGALTFEQREADDFDAVAVGRALEQKNMEQDNPARSSSGTLPCGCPGALARKLEPEISCNGGFQPAGSCENRLQNWPVQLQLIPVNAPYLQESELVLAAHCSAFAAADFHGRYLGPGKTLVIACPKLDDAVRHAEKLTQLIAVNNLTGITVLRMEVPCCGGLQRITEMAIARSGKEVPLRLETIKIK